MGYAMGALQAMGYGGTRAIGYMAIGYMAVSYMAIDNWLWLLDTWTLVIWVHVWQLVFSYGYMAMVINYMDRVKFGFLQFGVRTNFMWD
jgi:hypothetical protein